MDGLQNIIMTLGLKYYTMHSKIYKTPCLELRRRKSLSAPKVVFSANFAPI